MHHAPVRFPLRLLSRRLVTLLCLPVALAAQTEVARPIPPLAQFASLRVAIVPVQLWRADTAGWSAAVSWMALRPQLDSAITAALRDRGLGDRWSYAEDVLRSAQRNRLYSRDPTAIGVGRWRAGLPKPGETLSPLVADNLRSVTALGGDMRHVLIPVELRGEGDTGILRVVLADTRTRTVMWAADLSAPAGPALLHTLGERLADLILEP